MGRQIIQQPDGKFAVWSSNSDSFLMIDATKQEIVDEFAEEARRDAVEHVEQIFTKLANGIKPYYQFTLTWEEAIADYERIHKKVFEPMEF
ncbi:MAG: hypothetical protein LAO08_06440 [Acidobacteriia bacterium]|nr:hypothetical protein [Terriglobia bacterium]